MCWKSVLAILAGFGSMAVVVVVSTALAVKSLVRPGTKPDALPASYLVINLASGALAAMLGGFVTVRLAPSAPMNHVWALAVLLVFMSIVSAHQSGSAQPAWYGRTIGAIGVGGALLGGWLGAAF